MLLKDDALRDLWVRYKNSRDTQSRNEIVVHYSSLVNRVVNRIAAKYGDYIDIDDLTGYGIFGLLDAIEKFDIDKGVKFETYASLRIRGAIIDQIRDQDWIPRSLRARAKEIQRAIDEMEMELGRQVEDEELASRMGMTVEELQKIMGQLHSFTILSLDDQILDMIGDSSTLHSEFETPEEYTIAEELKSLLAQAIDELPDKEKKVVSLYYFDELTLKEIGMVIGVSESRVSQLHSRALIKLKNRLNRINAI